MRTIGKSVRTVVCGTALMLMALPGISSAAEHGGMSGMKMDGNGGMKMGDHGMMNSGGHDMMKMGDKVFTGKIGPWHGEARLMDMKAQMEHAKGSGMKMEGMMGTHHIALSLTDPKTRSRVTEGKGTVTVAGPDGKAATSDFMVMQGHFGADVNLPAPGKYTFKTRIESGGKKGSATFTYTLK
ncbi:MAG: iron transporter [Deltaproteobacteria bacterium]|nr:iron transporter [Deltaproteobacteria bacterium]MDA8178777.1 hypothetical protein [Deltaproteobacteria bacterium]